MTSIEIPIHINDTYIPVRSIPVVDCNRFSLKPLSWLQFLGCAIYGREGHISAGAGGPIVDYQSAIQTGACYYFTSAGIYTVVSVGFMLII